MTDGDSAFLWETEALRAAPGRVRGRGVFSEVSITGGGDWLTLKEASEATGVPSETIRKWARHDNIPSFLEKTDDGHLRIVSLRGIRSWAEEIGRDLTTADTVDDAEEDVVVDLTSETETSEGASQPQVPEGSMLVPLDAWNKMLNQLGNLHEAGQQLAEARERAAKAETEARFLKERLSDLREELERARSSAANVEESGPAGDSAPGSAGSPRRPAVSPTLGGTAAAVARKIYEGWRQRRRNR